MLNRYVDRVSAGHCGRDRLATLCSRTAASPKRVVPRQGCDPVGAAGGCRHGRGQQPHGSDSHCLDMGGTSTDVSHYAGRFELVDESVVAGVPSPPMMQILPSRPSVVGVPLRRHALSVGPRVGGAQPDGLLPKRRPADGHRRNLFLGRIVPDRFPAVSDRMATSRSIRSVQARLEEVAAAMAIASRSKRSPGLLEIAVAICRCHPQDPIARAMTSVATRSPASARRRPARLPCRRCLA